MLRAARKARWELARQHAFYLAAWQRDAKDGPGWDKFIPPDFLEV